MQICAMLAIQLQHAPGGCKGVSCPDSDHDAVACSMGGRAHYFAAEGGLPHTVIRDLQASGASTVSPGLLPLQPLGSADSFGTSPGGPIGTPHDNMDHGFSHELLSGSTGWQSLRNDSTDKQTPRTT